MIESPRITSDRWPSGYSVDAFANDAVRLEGARTDAEKFLALFRWNQRVMRHGYGYAEGPSVSALIASRRPWIGAMPAASILAWSMPVA